MSDWNAAMPDGSPPTPSSVPLRLTAIEGPIAGKTFAFTQAGTFLIGRSTRAQFVFPSGSDGDPRISHSHCMIECDPPLCRVHDLGSQNGTFVNGERLASSFLRNGDTLRIGRSVLRIELFASRGDEADDLCGEYDNLIPLPENHPKPLPVGRPACPICRHVKTTAADALCPKCQIKAEAVPQIVPGYRLIRAIGKGEMGIVYRALSERLGRAVAVKIIDLAAPPSPTHLARFLRAADILKRLRHRHIVAFHDVGTADQSLYLAMDYIHGADAAKLLRQRGALKVDAAVRLVCQLLSALKYAHALRFVHRDLKPANLLIRIRPDRKTVKVADFGLARILQETRVSGTTLPGDSGGTTAFLAPERVLDCRGATPAADQYSAAATLYNLLTRKFVYDQPKSVPKQLAQILDEEVVPIRDRRYDLPPKLIGVVHRALSRDPSRRFPDVAAFKKELLPFGQV